MHSEIAIKSISPIDLPEVACVHCAAFSGELLTALGYEAVRRYYEWLLSEPHEVTALAAYTGEDLVGFCIGGVFHRAFIGYLMRNRRYLTGCVLARPWIAVQPRFWDRLHRAVHVYRHRRRPVAPDSPALWRQSFGILAVAIHPDCQGQGIGKRLLLASELIAREKGFHSLHLTVHPENRPAIGLYESLGFGRQPDGAEWKGFMRKHLA